MNNNLTITFFIFWIFILNIPVDFGKIIEYSKIHSCQYFQVRDATFGTYLHQITSENLCLVFESW